MMTTITTTSDVRKGVETIELRDGALAMNLQ